MLMTARHIKTGDTYEGGYTYIGSIIGLNRTTLWRWEHKKGLKEEEYNGYIVRFEDIIREKQKKGFALKKKQL